MSSHTSDDTASLLLMYWPSWQYRLAVACSSIMCGGRDSYVCIHKAALAAFGLGNVCLIFGVVCCKCNALGGCHGAKLNNNPPAVPTALRNPHATCRFHSIASVTAMLSPSNPCL
jgi:hypothetical protein